MFAPLEIKILVYGALALLFAGGNIWIGHHFTASHYEALINHDRIAQDAALQTAQRAVIAADAARRTAETRANDEHELLVKADTASRDAVLGSVHGLESALHILRVPPAVDHSGGPQGPPAVPGGDSELERAVASLNSAFEKEVGACQHDAGNYAYILSIAPTAKVIP